MLKLIKQGWDKMTVVELIEKLRMLAELGYEYSEIVDREYTQIHHVKESEISGVPFVVLE